MIHGVIDWLIDLVLGAASSLFRFMFDEISEKILDSEYIISFPDITVQVRTPFIIIKITIHFLICGPFDQAKVNNNNKHN